MIINHKVRKLLITILAGFLTFILTSSPFAKDKVVGKRKKYFCEESEKPDACQDRLRLKFDQLKGNEFVEGYIIKGDDIIEIIKRTSLDIKISDSIIEGGLNFTELPEVTKNEIEKLRIWPSNWTEENIKAFNKRHSSYDKLYLVDNVISIINSEIRPENEYIPSFSIKSENTLFYKKADFSITIFSG